MILHCDKELYMKYNVCICMLLALSVSLVSTHQLFATAEPASGTASKVNELLIGVRAFAFIVQAECSACEQVAQWFADAAEAFPEIQLVLVSPSPAAERVETSSGAIPIVPDTDGLLAVALGVARAPTVVVASDETIVARLDWPFSREDLFGVLTAQRPRNTGAPNPEPHLATRFKELVTVDLHGKRTALVDLPVPMLLVFINLGCPACMDLLPPLKQQPASADGDGGNAAAAAAADAGVDEDTLARYVAFFLRTCPGLSKVTIGELLGDPDKFFLKVNLQRKQQ